MEISTAALATSGVSLLGAAIGWLIIDKFARYNGRLRDHSTRISNIERNQCPAITLTQELRQEISHDIDARFRAAAEIRTNFELRLTEVKAVTDQLSQERIITRLARMEAKNGIPNGQNGSHS